MSRTSKDELVNGRLLNGFDYFRQAWVKEGRYVRCGHVGVCDCYGKKHEGEETRPELSRGR